MRNLKSIPLAILLGLPVGCATTTASAPAPAEPLSTVSDADFGRLTSDQIRPVDDARARLALARDELGRAKLDVVNDQHEAELARSDRAASSADMSHAVAERKIGSDSNEPGQMRQASDDTKAAQQRMEVADARLAFADKLSTSRAAQVTAAERKVNLMVKKVNVAKLQSLEDAGMPIASRYDHAAAMEQVMVAQREYDSAEVVATVALTETSNAQQHWQYLAGKSQ